MKVSHVMRQMILDSARRVGGELRLDTGETIFLARQLEEIESFIYQQEFPENQADACIPVAGGDAWANYIVWRYMQVSGRAKLINDWATDFPNVGLTLRENYSPIREWGDSFTYSYSDLNRAAKQNISLDGELGRIAREAFERERDRVAWFGEPMAGVPGFLTNPNIGRGVAALNAATTSTLWSTKTSTEIVTDIQAAIMAIVVATAGIHYPNTILIPPAPWETMVNRPMVTGQTTSILEFLKQGHPEITFIKVQRLATISTTDDPTLIGTGAGNTGNCLVAYVRDPIAVKQRLNLPFMMLPPFWDGSSWTIKCFGRYGGSTVQRPRTVYKLEGI